MSGVARTDFVETLLGGPGNECCCLGSQQLVASGKLELLQEMYREWPFFQVTLDMVEMVFAKADPRVSLLYEEHLVSKDLVPFGDTLRRYVIKIVSFSFRHKSEATDVQ